MSQADRDACKEAELKNEANTFTLKKETSSRSFYSSVISFLSCSGLQTALSRSTDNLLKIVQVVLGKTNRDFEFPVDESCASSHHPSTAII